MIGGPFAREATPHYLLPSNTDALAAEDIDPLWAVVRAIHAAWGDPVVDPLHFRSQWLEFVTTRAEQQPSYLAEYRSAARVLSELNAVHGDDMWLKLFHEHGGPGLETRLGHLRKYVVEEFIRVWLAAGGFRAYGAENYNGYVSGSRFAVRPSYRRA